MKSKAGTGCRSRCAAASGFSVSIVKTALTVDTFPKREFPGHIVEIRTQSEYTPRNVQTLDQRMDQVFGVKVAIDPVPELKPGMAAAVRLLER